MAELPNILVLLSDSHAAYASGCYGSETVRTPAIDRLADEGVLFERAYTVAPICVPSRLSFLTGCYSWRIGAWNNMSPPADRINIPAMLSSHGYSTAAFGKMHFVGPDRLWGFDARPYGDLFGISHQPDPIDTAPHLLSHPGGHATIAEDEMQESYVTRLGIDFLHKHDHSRPLCLWLSYNRPHFPNRPPARYFDLYYPEHAQLPPLPENHPDELHSFMQHHERFYRHERLSVEDKQTARAGYFGNVSFVDDQIAAVLDAVDALRLRDDTIVIYFSDHGSANGEHDIWRISNFYDPTVRVPLIIRFPATLSPNTPVRVSETVELVDLLPTIADLAGVSPPEDVDGTSLLPLIFGGSTAGRKGYVVSEYSSHSVPAPMRMILRDNWKLCMYLDAGVTLFNLADDPDEFVDRSGDPGAHAVRRELEEIGTTGWDESLVRANFRYAPSVEYIQVHHVERAPNQILTDGGEYVDVETFYRTVDWHGRTAFH